MTRIPPAEQLGQLAEQLAMGARQGTEAEDLTSTLVRLGARVVAGIKWVKTAEAKLLEIAE